MIRDTENNFNKRQENLIEAAGKGHGGVSRVSETNTMHLDGGQLLGAPPSNTAPSNYIDDTNTQVLRYGVDSLYLSYPGTLSKQAEQRLLGLKLAAKGSDEQEQSNAQFRIKDHLLEVKDRGRGKFQFVLQDNCFDISVSSSSSVALPLAYTQLSSELLTAVGVTEAEKMLRYIINTLGLASEAPNISRVDLFVDFTTSAPLETINHLAWVTRAQKISAYYINRALSGWSVGLGGSLGARLYNKTLELNKSKKDYLKPLWKMSGWNESDQVWRLEFELKRDALKELGIIKVDDLLPNTGSLWRYGTSTWLRLTSPNDRDENQTRWPTHPLWQALSAIEWDNAPALPMGRLRHQRVPHDESLFINGLGGITSFMAREGITDLGEGFGEFLARAQHFHDSKGHRQGKDFADYVQDKVASKGRKYNTIHNKDNSLEAKVQAKAAKETYRKGRDGE